MHNERRGAPRTSKRVTVSLTDSSAELVTETNNLSASGAYCTVNRFIAPMTKLTMRFNVSDGAHPVTIHCTGVVVRTDPSVPTPHQARYSIAVFFSDVAERDRATITQFVRQHVQLASGGKS